MPVRGFDNSETKGRGGDWIILVFSLLLAFFLWSILKLSGEYSAYFSYRLVVKTNLEGRTEQADSQEPIVLRGKSSGFYILQQRYSREAKPIYLTLDSRMLSADPEVADRFFLLPAHVRHLVQEALGDDIQLDNITTDTAYFAFPLESYKKVPVAVRSQITYKAQYMPFGPVTVKPDSVILYGRTALLETIDSVYTAPVRANRTETTLQGVVPLLPIEGIRFSVREVFYSQEIGRYFERSVKVPVTAVNVPEGMAVILLPSEVEIYYRAGFRTRRQFAPSDFQVTVDGSEAEAGQLRMRPEIRKAPSEILSLRVEPHFIECFIN